MSPRGEPKVAMVVPVGRSGYLFYSFSLCEALARCGADVTLVTSQDSEETDSSKNNLRIVKLLGGMKREQPRLLRGLDYGASLVRLWRFLRRERFDIAHFQDTFVPYADAPFLKLMGGSGPKTVFTAHDPDQGSITQANRRILDLHRPALGQIYRACDGVVVMSTKAREDIVDMFQVSEAKVTRIPHGNYESYGTNNTPSRDEARGRLQIAGDRNLVLFFGSLKPSKGIEHLIRAFALLHEAMPAAHLLVAGEPRGVDVSGCEALISELDLEGAMSFRPGYVPPEQVPDYFAAADIVALPYLRIYQSGVLHLAYSFGRSVVATRVGGLAEDLDEGKSGLLVPPADEGALAAALQELLNDPDRLTAMGEHARVLSETVYSWDGIARQTLDLYHALLDRKAA
jgi:glycosyltransferase involved in cell wall biosynthesis